MRMIRVWLAGISLAIVGAACSTSSTNPPEADAGNLADANAAGVTCTGPERITFHLNVPSDQIYCEGKEVTCAPAQFITVNNADGSPVLLTPRPCVSTCDKCEEMACPDICALPNAIAPTGIDFTWDGTYQLHNSCGEQRLNCLKSYCVEPGSYVAHMCAFGSGTSDAGSDGIPACSGPGEAAKCVDVPFTWPPEAGAVITGTIAN